MNRLKFGIFRIFDPREWNLNLNSSELQKSFETNLGAISWELKIRALGFFSSGPPINLFSNNYGLKIVGKRGRSFHLCVFLIIIYDVICWIFVNFYFHLIFCNFDQNYVSSEIGLDKTVAKYFVLRIIYPVKNDFLGTLTVKIEIFLVVT